MKIHENSRQPSAAVPEIRESGSGYWRKLTDVPAVMVRPTQGPSNDRVGGILVTSNLAAAGCRRRQILRRRCQLRRSQSPTLTVVRRAKRAPSGYRADCDIVTAAGRSSARSAAVRRGKRAPNRPRREHRNEVSVRGLVCQSVQLLVSPVRKLGTDRCNSGIDAGGPGRRWLCRQIVGPTLERRFMVEINDFDDGGHDVSFRCDGRSARHHKFRIVRPVPPSAVWPGNGLVSMSPDWCAAWFDDRS